MLPFICEQDYNRCIKDPNLIAKISGHVENSRAFNRYRDIDEEMAKEVILKLE